MTEARRNLVARCRECGETFEGDLLWNNDGDIIYPSPLLEVVQEHHDIDSYKPFSHNLYGLYLDLLQLDQQEFWLPGILGGLAISGNCFPQGHVKTEHIK